MYQLYRRLEVMKVKVIKRFTDIKAGKQRRVGEVFEVTKERLREIAASQFGPLVEVVAQKGDEKKNEQSN